MAATNSTITDIASQTISQAFKEYKWYNTLSLTIDLCCAVHRLDIPSDLRISYDVPDDVFITAHLICNQVAMHDCPVSTCFGFKDEARNSYSWDYVMNFPLKMRDLSVDAVIAFTAWTPEGRVFGGTTMRLFDDYGALKRGKQKLMFFFGTEGDPNVIKSLNQTPGDAYDYYFQWDQKFKMEKHLEEFNSRMHNNVKSDGKLEWLDRLTIGQVQDTLDGPGPNDLINTDFQSWGDVPQARDLETFCFLIVEMPQFQYPVRYSALQKKHTFVCAFLKLLL